MLQLTFAEITCYSYRDMTKNCLSSLKHFLWWPGRSHLRFRVYGLGQWPGRSRFGPILRSKPYVISTGNSN